MSSVCGSLSGSHFDCSRAESLHLRSHPLGGVSALYRRVNHHSRVHSSEVVSKMLAEDDPQMDKQVVDVAQNVSQNETQQPFVEKNKDDDAVEEPKNVYRGRDQQRIDDGGVSTSVAESIKHKKRCAPKQSQSAFARGHCNIQRRRCC